MLIVNFQRRQQYYILEHCIAIADFDFDPSEFMTSSNLKGIDVMISSVNI